MGYYSLPITEFYAIDENGNKINLGHVYGGTINFKDEKSMEEKLNEYLEKNNIEIDENGNFEMYVVVDADDTDHEVGSIHCSKKTEVYSKERAFEDLQEKDEPLSLCCWIENPLYSSTTVKKQITIKEDLLTIEDKIFKVVVNKENVTLVSDDIVFVNKYKVIEDVPTVPILKFKIKSISDNIIEIVLYNNLTLKSKQIALLTQGNKITNIDNIKALIDDYLAEDERRVALINSIADDGVEL